MPARKTMKRARSTPKTAKTGRREMASGRTGNGAERAEDTSRIGSRKGSTRQTRGSQTIAREPKRGSRPGSRQSR